MRAFILPAIFLSVFSVNAVPKSLGDINKVAIHKSLPLYTQSGGRIFFSRTTDVHGAELWVTDGTQAGTALLKDIESGTGSSLPFGFTPAKFGANYGAYFFARTAVEGYELWKTDGTTAGTVIVKDINPGPDSGVSASFFSLGRIATDPEQSLIFFVADDGSSGDELWASSDGTSANTGMWDLAPGAGSSNPEQLQIRDNILLFIAETPAEGKEPWVYLGFLFPFPIDDIVPGPLSSTPTTMHLMGSNIVLQADDGSSGNELWPTDNTNPPALIADFTPGSADTAFFNLTRLNDTKLLFSMINLAQLKVDLRSTNGTAGSAPLVKQIDCLPGGFLNFLAGSLSSAVSSVLNGVNYFPCLSVFGGESELWQSDGTADGTRIVKQIFKGNASAEVSSFSRGDNRLVFAAHDGEHGYEPWVTDGSSNGTRLIKDYNPGEADTVKSDFLFYSLLSSNLSTATASLLPIIINNKAKVLYTDGTRANSRILFDDSSESNYGSEPAGLFNIGRNIFFAASHGTHGRELFTTRGSKRTTRLFKNINSGGSSNPEVAVKLNKDRAVFQATTSEKGSELFVTDGSEAGTVQIKNLIKGNGTTFEFNLFSPAIRKKVFFTYAREDIGSELWVTDGTKRGTRLVKDVYSGQTSSAVNELVKLGGRAVFTATDSTSGEELWVSNGKPAGTVLLKDIVPGAGSSEPYGLVSAGDKVFFGAETAAGRELWVTDGTTAGTVMVKDIYPGANGSTPFYMTSSGGFVFFHADNGTEGTEPWRTDGTSAGTVMIRDLNPGGGDTIIYDIASLGNGAVVLKADDGSGAKLWTANSAAGSFLSLNVSLSATSNFYFYKIPKRNAVIFAGYSAANGAEPWITDGSLAGTFMLEDVLPGTDSSNPSEFFVKGRKLYISGRTTDKGAEPFAIRLP